MSISFILLRNFDSLDTEKVALNIVLDDRCHVVKSVIFKKNVRQYVEDAFLHANRKRFLISQRYFIHY